MDAVGRVRGIWPVHTSGQERTAGVARRAVEGRGGDGGAVLSNDGLLASHDEAGNRDVATIRTVHADIQDVGKSVGLVQHGQSGSGVGTCFSVKPLE